MDNFRKGYYSTLGVKSVEVQSSLSSALGDEPLNINKLQKLCLWVRIPHSYRPLVWKVLLKCWPQYKEMWKFAENTQKIEVDQILKCITLISETALSQEELLVKGVLLCILECNYSITPLEFLMQIQNTVPDHLKCIARAFLDISISGDTEAFVLFRSFMMELSVPVCIDHDCYFITKQLDFIGDLIKIHDRSMFDHLTKTQINLDKCLMYS